jgi:hypothetical protein
MVRPAVVAEEERDNGSIIITKYDERTLIGRVNLRRYTTRTDFPDNTVSSLAMLTVAGQ